MDDRHRKYSQLLGTERKSRWLTAEYLFYSLYLVLIFAWGVPETIRMSQEALPRIRSRLSVSNSLVYGRWRLLDNSDAQYAGFRNNLPVLFGAMSVYLMLSHSVRRLSRPPATGKQPKLWSAFLLLFSLLFIAVLHGPAGLLKILTILTVNYALGLVAVRFQWRGQLPTWLFCIAILFLNDLYAGYTFKSVFPPLEFLDQPKFTGIIQRWYITFNITVLRMISFNTDRLWAATDKIPSVPKSDGNQSPVQRSRKRTASNEASLSSASSTDISTLDKQRTRDSRPLSEYNFLNYLMYCLYCPLYLAGPIITFNNFMSQIVRPKINHEGGEVEVKNVVFYGLRLAGTLFLMETMMHYIYVVAMSKEKIWDDLTPIQLALFSYFNLKYIWLKLLIIWRFFRFWSLADGIDPPENMIRCMSNNYSAVGFWRDWHRSYNRWLVRYLYIPLGGRKYQMYNMWAVFTFVAIWHDIQLRLLVWGWLICLFILPEIFATIFYNRYLYKTWYGRHLAACGASLNIMMMIVANLVGFCLGVDGALAVFSRIFTWSALGSLTIILLTLFCAAQIMFELRNNEKSE